MLLTLFPLAFRKSAFPQSFYGALKFQYIWTPMCPPSMRTICKRNTSEAKISFFQRYSERRLNFMVSHSLGNISSIWKYLKCSCHHFHKYVSIRARKTNISERRLRRKAGKITTTTTTAIVTTQQYGNQRQRKGDFPAIPARNPQFNIFHTATSFILAVLLHFWLAFHCLECILFGASAALCAAGRLFFPPCVSYAYIFYKHNLLFLRKQVIRSSQCNRIHFSTRRRWHRRFSSPPQREAALA